MNEVRYSRVNLMRVAHAFPAAARIMVRLGALLRDPAAGLGEIAVLLRQDSALAARLLRIANSAAFSPGEPVASIEDAAALIGLQEIHRLVGAVAVDPFAHRNYPLYGFTGPRLRDNALIVALLMEELAGPAREDASAAYTAGLFRSLGKLAMATIADEHAPVAPLQSASASSLVAWEKFTFGLSGNQATAIILHEWRFPGPVMQAIEEHYAPTGHGYPLARLLNLAAGLAEQLGHSLPGESACWIDPNGSDHPPGIGPRHLQRATERAVAAFDRLSRALA